MSSNKPVLSFDDHPYLFIILSNYQKIGSFPFIVFKEFSVLFSVWSSSEQLINNSLLLYDRLCNDCFFFYCIIFSCFSLFLAKDSIILSQLSSSWHRLLSPSVLISIYLLLNYSYFWWSGKRSSLFDNYLRKGRSFINSLSFLSPVNLVTCKKFSRCRIPLSRLC